MFYHQGILQKRGGKFGIIWLAATRIENLKRRELCEVNLQKACDDIIDYILMRVQAKGPGKSKPRLSLYLSSQLMFGVTRVYGKHCSYLMDDASTFFTRLRLATATMTDLDIDLRGVFRGDTVTFPDMATIGSPSQPGFDPSFGLLRMRASTEAKITYPVLEMWRVNSSLVVPGSPLISPVPVKKRKSDSSEPSTPKQPSHIFQPELGSPHTVSSKDEITITEVEMQIPDIEVPGEQDLPQFDGKEISTILDEPHGSRVDWMAVLSPVVPGHQRETTLVTRDGQAILSPREVTPFARPDGEVPQRRDVTFSPGVTPIPKIGPVQAPRARPSLTMQLTPVTPSPVRRRRRRHLCIDRETQIPKGQLKRNMKTSADTTMPLVLPDPRNSSVKELFSKPGKKELMHPSLLPLWQLNTQYGIAETASDLAVPVWTVPELLDDVPRSRKRLRTSLSASPTLPREPEVQPPDQQINVEVPQEQPSIEVPRDRSLSMEKSLRHDDTPVSLRLSRSALSDHHSVLSDQKSKDSFRDEPSAKKSRLSRKTRSQGGTFGEDDLLEHPQTKTLSEPSIHDPSDVSNRSGELSIVHEEAIHVDAQLDVILPTEQETSPKLDILIRNIEQLEKRKKVITFQDICPRHVSSRIMAAKMFAGILDLCRDNKLETEQDAPFDDIYITRGSNW